jgi:hypothetical protein
MTTSTSTVVAQTIEGLAPAIIAAAIGSSGSQTGVAVALSFMQAAAQMQQAGQMTADDLVKLFQTVSSGIQTAHDKWVAMNTAQT